MPLLFYFQPGHQLTHSNSEVISGIPQVPEPEAGPRATLSQVQWEPATPGKSQTRGRQIHATATRHSLLGRVLLAVYVNRPEANHSKINITTYTCTCRLCVCVCNSFVKCNKNTTYSLIILRIKPAHAFRIFSTMSFI